MAENECVFDSWAWWEYFGNTLRGRRLARKYVRAAHFRIHSSILTLLELSGKFARLGRPDRIQPALDFIQARARIHSLTPAVAAAAGPLQVALRRIVSDASILDAAILATAREIGCRLVSGDSAFRQEPDVTDH